MCAHVGGGRWGGEAAEKPFNKQHFSLSVMYLGNIDSSAVLRGRKKKGEVRWGVTHLRGGSWIISSPKKMELVNQLFFLSVGQRVLQAIYHPAVLVEAAKQQDLFSLVHTGEQ